MGKPSRWSRATANRFHAMRPDDKISAGANAAGNDMLKSAAAEIARAAADAARKAGKKTVDAEAIHIGAALVLGDARL